MLEEENEEKKEGRAGEKRGGSGWDPRVCMYL